MLYLEIIEKEIEFPPALRLSPHYPFSLITHDMRWTHRTVRLDQGEFVRGSRHVTT